jgi:hypothetical protein
MLEYLKKTLIWVNTTFSLLKCQHGAGFVHECGVLWLSINFVWNKCWSIFLVCTIVCFLVVSMFNIPLVTTMLCFWFLCYCVKTQINTKEWCDTLMFWSEHMNFAHLLKHSLLCWLTFVKILLTSWSSFV